MKKHIIIFISTITLFISTIIYAEEIKIGTGNLSDEYTNIIVPAISEALQDYGYTAIAEKATNHQESIDNVLSGNLPVALSPLDVAALSMTPAYDPDESLLLVGGKLVPEALFCVAYKGGSIVNYDDITGEREKPLKISVGDKNSTTARTFISLMKIVQALKNIEFYHKEKLNLELNRLLSGRRDLVCFVTMPNPDNELIKMVMEHDELFFININHPSFAITKIGKIRIYDIMELPVSRGFFGFNQKTIKTLVTWVGLVVNENQVEPKLLDALATIVMEPDLLPSNTLMAKAKRLFDKAVSQIEKLRD